MELPSEVLLGAAGTVILTGGGAILTWFARKLNSIEAKADVQERNLGAMSDTMVNMMHKLYGDPNDKTPDGLVAKQREHHTRIDTVERLMDDFEPRLAAVEDHCAKLPCGDISFRPARG